MTELYSDEDKRHIPSTADFWRSLGHNVIPARHGKPIEDWKRWQYEQIPKSQHELWKYNHSFDSGMMVMLGKSWLSSQYLWVAIPTVTTTTTNQRCTDRNCKKRIETDSKYCRYCGTKQKYDDRIQERIFLNELSDGSEDPHLDEKKICLAIDSLIRGYDGPPLPAERVFKVWQYDVKKKFYCYLYGYCEQPFPDLKLKGFDIRTSGIVYCDSMISVYDHDDKRTYQGIYADVHETIIPFHEFVSGESERVFELINELAQKNINNRPVFGKDGTSMWPFALLEDWREANRLIGGEINIDVKNITGDYLASKVREYTRIYPYEYKIMSSRSFGKQKRISVKELIFRYYAPLLEKHQLQLRPHLLGWLKEKMEERSDWCEYAMWCSDNQEAIKRIYETILKYRKDPDNKGTAKLLAEDIAAAKYILKNINRSFTISEQNPVAIRDAWKVLLLDDFHLEWLKDFLLYELQESKSKCDTAIMDHLLEIIDGRPPVLTSSVGAKI